MTLTVGGGEKKMKFNQEKRKKSLEFRNSRGFLCSGEVEASVNYI